MADDVVVKPYRLERPCQPQADMNQLVLKAVDATESVYSRTLVQLANASLPDVVVHPTEGAARTRLLDLTSAVVTFPGLPPGARPAVIARDNPFDPTNTRPPDVVIVDPVPPPEPTTPPPPPEEPEAIVRWDLYLMLKYRQDWKPSGYGLGQLVYSVSLLPNEELTLEVKTWETSRTQQDQTDETEEKNASDIKSTASDSKDASHSDESKTHEYVDAKAGYSGFGFSAEVSAGWSEDVSTAHTAASKQAREQSQQATSQYRATHKVQMASSREAGSESRTSRKIKNINQAHTLNANYYEILREFDVSLELYDVSMVLLGATPSLNEPTPYYSWGEVPHLITLGELIRQSRNASWIDRFIDEHGLSPIQVLRERWAEPLYTAAPPNEEVGPNTPLLPEQRAAFRSAMLRFVRPSPGWVEPDCAGVLRWAYEVIRGQEQKVLEYLYAFVPNSASQTLARALQAGMERPTAYRAIVERTRAYSAPSAATVLAPRLAATSAMGAAAMVRAVTPIAPGTPATGAVVTVNPGGTAGGAHERGHVPELRLAAADEILVAGPFQGTPIAKLKDRVTEWVGQISSELNAVRETIGSKETWKTTLPTQGVYADLALGICSGAEDYIEIQRQYDLEMKRLEVEKLKLEVERLRIEKERIAQGKPASAFVVETPSTNTAVKLDVTLGADAKGGLTVKPPEEA